MRVFILAMLPLLSVGGLVGQDAEITADDLVEARELMSDIEAGFLRSGEDKKASALILASKLADETAYGYLIGLPGYEDAVANGTLLDFMEEMKKEYRDYKRLHKQSQKARKQKHEYLASVHEQYAEAAALYDEVK